jgi:hypothetical protein
MAKVKLNPVIDALQGKVGDLVFKRWEGEDIVSKMPDRTGIEPSVSQLAQMEKFRLAAIYGKAVLADQASHAIYADAAARRGIPMFALTVGDFLNAPAVDEIDLSAYTGKAAEVIRVRASDDMEVKGVTVEIRKQDGTLLEGGPAVWKAASGSWEYTTTTALTQGQAVSIDVSATDRPGHKGTKSETRD